MNHDTERFVSILLAVVVVVGGLLAFDYFTRQTPKPAPAPSLAIPKPQAPHGHDDSRPLASAAEQLKPPSTPGPAPRALYKCLNEGKVEFSDKPCGNVVSVADLPKTVQINDSGRPRTYREQYENVVRNRPQSAQPASPAQAVASVAHPPPSCEALQQEIDRIVSIQRMPLSAHDQDRYTKRKRVLQDLKFERGC